MHDEALRLFNVRVVVGFDLPVYAESEEEAETVAMAPSVWLRFRGKTYNGPSKVATRVIKKKEPGTLPVK